MAAAAATSKKNKSQATQTEAKPRELPKERAQVVIGDGWSAIGLVGLLAQVQNQPVVWIAGSSARFFSPLPTLEISSATTGAEAWSMLSNQMGISPGELQHGSFLREFRNKAFREPSWTKAPTPEDRKGVRDEMLWAPEKTIAPVFEGRFALTVGELETLLHEKLATLPQVYRIEGVPVYSISLHHGKIDGVTLGNGEFISAERVYYADRWKELATIEGMPKAIPFMRKRFPMGVLQAAFTHEQPMATGVQEGFFASLHKESGETIERHLWGYFTSDGLRSFWTICLSPEEAEDNHAIAKKLRRLKSSLDKMFAGSEWLPAGKAEFMNNVRDEKVRFEEDILFSEGEAPKELLASDEIDGLRFLTDGYGPTAAMEHVLITLQADGYTIRSAEAPSVDVSAEPNPEAESVNRADSETA